jgi:hypothetical protein
MAAARANVGIKAGRYFFEVRIMAMLNPAEIGHRQVNVLPRQQVRVGFSVPRSSLFLGETEDGVCFDSEGFFISGMSRTMSSQRFTRDQVVTVVLNLDESSGPHAQTVSLFRDGQRISQPQALPEHLRGRPLCPHVSFRNVSVQVHFGPEPLAALPFRCRGLQGAAQEDLAVAPPSVPPGGPSEVLLPVAVPDEGTFDRMDAFLEENPGFVELSDRKLVEWAQWSGVRTQTRSAWNDKPLFSCGIQILDDLCLRRVINEVAPLVPRNYVIMEVRSNLLKNERKELLRRFGGPRFRRVAQVFMGEPPEKHKVRVRGQLLKEKQARLDREFQSKQAKGKARVYLGGPL